MTQPVQFSPTLQQFGSDRAIIAYEELTHRSKHALDAIDWRRRLMERAEPPVAWMVEADNVPKQPGAAPTAHADCKQGEVLCGFQLTVQANAEAVPELKYVMARFVAGEEGRATQ